MNMHAIGFFFDNKKIALFIVVFIVSMLIPQNLQSQDKKIENSETSNVLDYLAKSINNYFRSPLVYGEVEQITQEALSENMLYSILTGLTSPTEPFSYGPYLIFIHYDISEEARVSIAFADEQYTHKHYFARLKDNRRILVYILLKRESTRTVEYRLVINGIWTHDHQNPNSIIDYNNVQVSITTMNATPRIFFPPFVYNRHKKQLRFFLYLDTKEAHPLTNTSLQTVDSSTIEHGHIYLVGNFTAWDPLLIRMQESSNMKNLYYADVGLIEGRHYYYFQVGNYDILDPQNKIVAPRRSKGIYVNTFVIDKTIDAQTGAPYLVAKIEDNYP